MTPSTRTSPTSAPAPDPQGRDPLGQGSGPDAQPAYRRGHDAPCCPRSGAGDLARPASSSRQARRRRRGLLRKMVTHVPARTCGRRPGTLAPLSPTRQEVPRRGKISRPPRYLRSFVQYPPLSARTPANTTRTGRFGWSSVTSPIGRRIPRFKDLYTHSPKRGSRSFAASTRTRISVGNTLTPTRHRFPPQRSAHEFHASAGPPSSPCLRAGPPHETPGERRRKSQESWLSCPGHRLVGYLVVGCSIGADDRSASSTDHISRRQAAPETSPKNEAARPIEGGGGGGGGSLRTTTSCCARSAPATSPT